MCKLGFIASLVTVASVHAAGTQGYYRMPCIHNDLIVFAAEGDLWKVLASGGVATRLTSHPGNEGTPRISPDGLTLAFTAEYEGPTEVYTMPFGTGVGGLPTRRTFEAARAAVVGWTPAGALMYTTDALSGLPNFQLATIDPKTGDRGIIPLAQASAGVYDDAGSSLFFTRLQFNGSMTKRYKGGTAQNLWRFDTNAAEAVPLTADFAGASKDAMWWQGRIYFATDRDGTMNIWSIKPDGTSVTQHTKAVGFDVASPSLSKGKIAFQQGADIHVYDIAANTDTTLNITLESDLDHTRENWVAKPMDYLSAAHLSPDGDRVVITARGSVFVAPHRQGRFVEVTKAEGVRYRSARFMPDGKSLVALSDASGETELTKLPANGVGTPEKLTTNADILRWDQWPSPDGAWIASTDKNNRLWLYNTKTKEHTQADQSMNESITDIAWSPDSRWIAYTYMADNLNRRVKIHNTDNGASTFVTTDRFESYSPAWSTEGQWLYLLSDRNIQSLVGSPWGPMQPEPFFDKTTKIYQIALIGGTRSPFLPKDELHKAKKDDAKKDELKKDEPKTPDKKPEDAAEKKPDPQPESKPEAKLEPKPEAEKKDAAKIPEVVIELAGIERRLSEVPVPAGNYGNLAVNDKALFWTTTERGPDSKPALSSVAIVNENIEVKQVVADIKSFELSADGKKILVLKDDSMFIIDAAHGPADLAKKDVVLNAWTMSITPREEWRQMFIEAWRLERDYFYDKLMHGVDWPKMRDKYLPLVDRVTTRAELSDVIAQMVAELSALHTFVRGGDLRQGKDKVRIGSLGATLARDAVNGGYRVEHVFLSDPDVPERLSPLARPGVNVVAGDVIESIDGVPTLSTSDCAVLLRHKADKQVLLRVKPASGGDGRDVIVVPISTESASDLRYHEWEYTRRLDVEKASDNQIGYLHLRAMGGGDYSDFAKGYYPVFNRQGLIIDVRHNRGGNIDSWILGKLLRQAWFFWSDRVGTPPSWNMQYAFRGHIVVLCNERTASDGEAFAEGFKRLGLGKVIGTRTWGGEIWLSGNNFLVDQGIATAAETGVYGPDGTWLIEGHGVDPDIIVDNLPHATFKGEDAQLKAAIEHLKKLIADNPVPPLKNPPKPDKSFKPAQ